MQKVAHEGTGQRRECFLWKLKKNSLWDLVLNHLYHAALNLNQKITHLVEQEYEVRYPQYLLHLQHPFQFKVNYCHYLIP